MSRVLTRYLIITGTMAAIILLMPDLVWFGLIAGVIPGLILMYAPTAFMWGCIFAGPWALFRRLINDIAAAIVALAILVGVIWYVPQDSQREGKAQLRRFHIANLPSSAGITPAGDVRLDIVEYSGTPNQCKGLCVALLFEPGVRSVTVNLLKSAKFSEIRDGTTKLRPSSDTYRLLPKGQCTGKSSRHVSISSPFGRTMDDNEMIEADWKRRLADEVCIQVDAPIDHHDLLLRAGRWNDDDEDKPRYPEPWSLSGNYASAGFADARTGQGKWLMRYYALNTSALSVPFRIYGNGGIGNFSFRWARENLSRNAYISWEDPSKKLDAALAVHRTPDRNRILVPLRATLQRSLSDTSLGGDAPVFDAVGNYLALLNKQNVTPEDTEIVERLIDDPRFDDLPNAGRLSGVFGADALEQLRAHMVRKLLALPPTVDPKTRQIGSAFERWPAGAFANLTSDEVLLLNDAGRRTRANGLIERLSDQGGAGAPLLTRILLDHHNALMMLKRERAPSSDSEPQHEYKANLYTFDSAVSALCEIGPAARNLLPFLMKIDADKDERWFEGEDWDRMMARVGKPIPSFTNPPNMSGNDARYQARTRGFVERFRPGECR